MRFSEQIQHRPCISLRCLVPAAGKQVDMERAGGQLLCAADGLDYLIWRQISNAERSKAASIGYSRRQLWRAGPTTHRPLENGVLDSQSPEKLGRHRLVMLEIVERSRNFTCSCPGVSL